MWRNLSLLSLGEGSAMSLNGMNSPVKLNYYKAVIRMLCLIAFDWPVKPKYFLPPVHCFLRVVLSFIVLGIFTLNPHLSYAATTVNLNQADIKILIKTVSDVTGKNFLFDPNIRGQVTIVSATPMDSDALYQTFLSALGVLGYAAIPDGDVVKIVAEDKARFESSDPITLSPPGQVTTKVFQLQRASASAVATLLKSFSPQWAQVAPGPNNTVIVSDRASNVDRFERLIAELDGNADLDSEAVVLKSLSAAEAVRMITQYLQQARAPDAPPSTASVMADERSNTLVILGTQGERARLLKLLGQLDQPGKTVTSNTQIVFLKHAQADQLLPALEALIQKYKPAVAGGATTVVQAPPPIIVANKALNALILSATADIGRELRSAIEQLDVRRAQVVVEVLVAEISRERSQDLGVNWALIDNNQIAAASVVNPSVLSALQGAVSSGSAAAATGAVGLGLTVAGGRLDRNGTSLGVVLNALRGDGTTNILSSPSIVTLDNEEAIVTVGQEVPFLTGSYTSTPSNTGGGAINPFQTIERKDVGLKLSVTPQINSGSNVLLKLKLEVSSLAAGATGAADLITNKRSIVDTVMVEDGQVLVLGGLVDDSATESNRGIPGLASLPGIGALFRSKSTSSTKRNLMVFLAPRILRSSEQADYYTQRKYEQLERQLPRQAQFLKESLGQLKATPSPTSTGTTLPDRAGWSLKLSDSIPAQPKAFEPEPVDP